VALLTGARQGELMDLTWDAVDFRRGLLSLAVTKAGRPRSVAVSSAAAAVLRRLWQRRGVSPFAFASRRLPPKRRPSFPRMAWEAAVRAAELENFRFHDLRHTFASYCLSEGASLPELAAALGHSTAQMCARYAHLERPHAARIAERVAARFSSAEGGISSVSS
jgi:integrase